jgi:integrase
MMTMIPCRPIALISIDPTRAQLRTHGEGVVVLAREKTDFGKGLTSLIIREEPETRLSPYYYFRLLNNRSTNLGAPHCLFCSERGQPYKRADVIGKGLVRLLARMGVKGYTGYSFRHSMIQALFDAGLDEKQVNAYTGHSNRSHTALDYYYHLDKQWAGAKIRARPTDRIKLCEGARRLIEAEDEREEDEERGDGDEAD